MGTFTQECGNLYRVTLAILEPCRTFICEPWKPSLGNFYSGTLWTRLLRNLYVGTRRTFGAFLKTLTCKPCENQYHVTFGTLGTLGTFTRNCCGNLHSVTLATLGALWNLYLGTLWEPLPWEPCWRPCTNLYSETFTWEPCGNLYHANLGNLYSATFTWERWKPSLGNFYSGTCGHVYFGTFMLEPGKPLLGNR